MTHREKSKVRFNVEFLQEALEFLMYGAQWKSVNWRSDCTWKSPQLLAVVALLWAWGDEKRVLDRLATSRRIASEMYTQCRLVASSFQAFMKLLIRWSANGIVSEIKSVLQRRMCEEFAELMKIGKYIIMAIDGSRIGLPHTKSCEDGFSVKRHKKKAKRKKYRNKSAEKKSNTITMWITTLWHCGTGLPWNWRLGPSDSSERSHWMEMLNELESPILFVGDAGFVGYEYAKAVLAAGHQSLIRIGSNVKLLKGLGHAKINEDLVFLWPQKAASRQELPLVFRLVVCHNGKYPVYLLTSVLSQHELSDSEVIAVYKRRWGIELFYRNLKQTFGKHKLQCRTPETAYVEMTWSFLGLWCMAIYALKQIHAKGESPSRLSFAKLIRAFQRMMRDFMLPVTKGAKLLELLQEAVIDEYERGSKTSRDYARKKHEHPPGPPIIKLANRKQIALSIRLYEETLEKKGLTA